MSLYSYCKYLAFLILFFEISPISQAQEVTYSQLDKYDSYSGDFTVVGKVGKNIYTYRFAEDNGMLDAYDDSMNKVATIILDFLPQKVYQIRFITYPDKMIVLYQGLEANKVIQYGAVLDGRGRLKKRPIELGAIKTGLLGPTRNYFYSAVSDDKKYILTYSADDKGSEIVFDGKWMDDSLKIINRSHAAFKTYNPPSHGEVNVGNDGTVYMAAYTPVGTLNYADEFWILSIAPGENKFSENVMDLHGKFAANGYIKIDNQSKQIYFGGFYADKKNGNFTGLLFSSYSIEEKKFIKTNQLPFDNELINTVDARNPNRAFDNFVVRHLIVKNDGGFVMISEAHFITTRSNYTPGIGYYSFYNSGMSSLVKEYHYNDILALSYDKDGKREWATVLPKEQYSQDDNGIYSSYTMLNSGGTLAFLYNDFNRSHPRLQLATIDDAGKTDFHSFTPEGNDNPDWMPKAGKQVAARTLLIPCMHKKDLCFAKVEF